MMATLTLALIIAATALDGLLAGASLDQSIKQLPARHRMGVVAFSAYSRAADLGNGVLWYALLGISAAVATLAAAVSAIIGESQRELSLPLVIAAFASVLHSLVTTQAAPISFSQRKLAHDEAGLSQVFDRFERWQAVRAAFQVLTFAAMLWALSIARH